MTIIRWLLASLLVWVAILLPQRAVAQGFGVGNYEVLSSTRVGRTTFDFVMRATITNNSLPAQGVLARATSTSTNTTLASRTLYFGDLAAGAVAVSTNTFTIRQNRLVPFDPSSLQWAVSVQSMSLVITLDSPSSGFLTNGTNIVVTGTVGANVTAVQVNGIGATLTGSNYTATVPLIEGKNTLSAVAQNVYGGSGAVSVQVSRDTMPPIITIGSPATGAVVSSAQITVGGNINDIASGTTVNGNQISVTVNGIGAAVANRSYVVPEILLSRGKNKITARAVDQAGNEGMAETEVVYQEPVAQKRLVLVGGNNQSGMIATTLPDPLLVALLDANGAALTNQPVTFAVTQNDGLVLAAPNAASQLTVLTDDKGLASVLFRLGLRTGAGNNQITVKSPGVVAEVVFSESSLVGDPVRISALLPETQVGETGKRLPAPWYVFVTDAGGNPVAQTPVTFTVSQGAGGMVNGAPQVTLLTDNDGKASVIHTLGSEEGINNNVVIAQLSTQTNSLVLFKASALTPQRPEDTRVVGLVLDNANQPMPNIFCGITGTRLITVTDQHGQFVISNAPVGAVRLFVDARDRGYPGTWHVLEFDLITVAGRANSVDRPIYMLSMDEAGSAIAGGDQDVTLQMKGIPGATMTILAHSLRDAAGQPVTERVLFTQVNAERLPMPPPRGSQFMLAWTVQPAGLRFNPPAKMCIPNTGLPPGQVIELFSFDHDLVQFAAIGTARVSADGSQICSDPGFGVIKSGWGGGAPPPPPPCSAACGSAPINTDCIRHEAVPSPGPCSCPTYKNIKAEILTVEAKADGTNELICATNKVISFTATATATNCSSSINYEWNFGDGTTANTKDATHSYANAGKFDVKLTARCGTCAASKKDAPPITVFVTGLNLVVHKPLVIDSAESAIPSADKLSKGSQTFVNLDNDDKDAAFDTGANDVAITGENEMVKLKVQLTNKDLKHGKVKLEASAGGANVKIWKKNIKFNEYASGTELAVPGDFTVVGSVLEVEFFVEGVTPHTAPQGTKLKMTYDQAAGVSDEVSMTVIGIESIAWEGKNNSLSDNNTLDADPNFPGLGVAGVRVFSDARLEGFFFPSPGSARDKVTVKATLSVAPVEPVNLYFKSFDVDDPTDAAAPVDDDTATGGPEDNRGTSPARAGKITGSDGTGVLALLFDAKEKSFEFQTTTQPGDNFRVVGSGDKNFLNELENDDLAAGASNADKQRIVNKQVTGTLTQREIRDPAKYATDVLTVWRFLHVEKDSMIAVPGTSNIVATSITDFTGTSAAATQLKMAVLLTDGSPDLDDATPGNGRFEKGTVRIGGGAITIAAATGNDDDEMIFPAAAIVPLPFHAEDNDILFNGTLDGNITTITKTNAEFVLTLSIVSHSETPIDWTDFVGGTVKIAGGDPLTITSVDSNAVTVTVGSLRIPVELTDDDSKVILPKVGDLTHLTTVMREAYVEVLDDEGGTPGNNQQTCPFFANVAPPKAVAEAAFQRQTTGTDSYWSGYLLMSYQYGPTSDNDPDLTAGGGEGGTGGVAFAAVSNVGVLGGGQGTQVFTETVRDRLANTGATAGLEERVTAHEIGHQLGLDHWDTGEGGVPAGAVPSNLMLRSMQSTPNANALLIPMHKNLIRSRVKSPGT